ncbi:MAG: MFS transporter [Deltaproteobacteria bacterium]|nr:MFS transporter [Deltaproteobacteria bacterium]
MKQASINTNYRWVILGTVCCIQFLSSMANASFGPLAPFLIADLGINRTQLGLFPSLLCLSTVLFSMPGGWLIDKFGVRRLLLLGPGVLGIFFALFSTIPNLAAGYLVVFLIGIGYLFLAPTTAIALIQWFPKKSRATAVSIKQSAVTAGTAIGAIIIPALSIWLGWRDAVTIIGIVVVLVAVSGFCIYREWSQESSRIQPPVLAAFRKVIANKNLLYLGIACIAYLALQSCINSYLVLELVELKSMPVIVAGTFLMVANIGGAVGRIIWGAVSDKTFNGKRKQVMTIIGLISGTLVIISSISLAHIHGLLLYIIITLIGACAFGWNGILNVFATELSGKETAATGLGWTFTISTFGGVLGPPLFGYIVDKTSSYTPAWLAVAVGVIAAAFLIAFIKEQEVI